MERKADVVTADELRVLVRRLLETRGAPGASRDEIEQVCNWAIETRTAALMLAMVLDGQLTVDVNINGEVVCGLPEWLKKEEA